jgi:hypothetical protein
LEHLVTDGPGATLTHELIAKSRAPENVFKDAGFNAIDTGRDVRNLDGFGVRSAVAAFDPEKAGRRGILLSLGALSPSFFEMASRPDPNTAIIQAWQWPRSEPCPAAGSSARQKNRWWTKRAAQVKA